MSGSAESQSSARSKRKRKAAAAPSTALVPVADAHQDVQCRKSSFGFEDFETEMMSLAANNDEPTPERFARMIVRYAKFNLMAMSKLLKRHAKPEGPKHAETRTGSQETAREILSANSAEFKDLFAKDLNLSASDRQAEFNKWLRQRPAAEQTTSVEMSLRRLANERWRHARCYVAKSFWARLPGYYAAPGPDKFILLSPERLADELARVRTGTRDILIAQYRRTPSESTVDFCVAWARYFLEHWGNRFPDKEFLERQRADAKTKLGATPFRNHPPRPSIKLVHGSIDDDDDDDDDAAPAAVEEDGEALTRIQRRRGREAAPASDDDDDEPDDDLDSLLR
eukprot:TRINITY_DN3931_c0_g1_i1.p1 TRINITY_DN3931_c0_g1~~TRINITY_DN3931_c0_g1_i1.p1  ORF type:complete len:340 (-),score=77.59 TRINITY_DN3931_c0_g1_i1:298-1317(-)